MGRFYPENTRQLLKSGLIFFIMYLIRPVKIRRIGISGCDTVYRNQVHEAFIYK
jgi:hypothetical protein